MTRTSMPISVHKQAKSPTELKAVMLCDDTWLSITIETLFKVCIDLIEKGKTKTTF